MGHRQNGQNGGVFVRRILGAFLVIFLCLVLSGCGVLKETTAPVLGQISLRFVRSNTEGISAAFIPSQATHARVRVRNVANQYDQLKDVAISDDAIVTFNVPAAEGYEVSVLAYSTEPDEGSLKCNSAWAAGRATGVVVQSGKVVDVVVTLEEFIATITGPTSIGGATSIEFAFKVEGPIWALMYETSGAMYMSETSWDVDGAGPRVENASKCKIGENAVNCSLPVYGTKAPNPDVATTYYYQGFVHATYFESGIQYQFRVWAPGLTRGEQLKTIKVLPTGAGSISVIIQ